MGLNRVEAGIKSRFQDRSAGSQDRGIAGSQDRRMGRLNGIDSGGGGDQVAVQGSQCRIAGSQDQGQDVVLPFDRVEGFSFEIVTAGELR